VKATVRHETADQVDGEFSRYGTVTARIADSVSIQRSTTKDISHKALPLVEEAFETIANGILT